MKSKLKEAAKQPDTWPLARDATSVIFGRAETLQDMGRNRLVCRFFSEAGRTVQRNRVMIERLIRINDNYPAPFITIMGAEFISQLPILKIGECRNFSRQIFDSDSGMQTNAMFWQQLGQDNVNQYTARQFIENADLAGAPIVRGIDINGRHFLCLNINETTTNQQVVVTYFQFTPNDNASWKVCRYSEQPTQLQSALRANFEDPRSPDLSCLIRNMKNGNNAVVNFNTYINLRRERFSVRLFEPSPLISSSQNPPRFPLLRCSYDDESPENKDDQKKCIVM